MGQVAFGKITISGKSAKVNSRQTKDKNQRAQIISEQNRRKSDGIEGRVQEKEPAGRTDAHFMHFCRKYNDNNHFEN